MTLKTKPSPASTIEAASGEDGADASAPGSHQDKDLPLLGLFAVGFGVLSILPFVPGGFIFAPLGLILGLVALFAGHIGYGLAAVLMAMVGIVTSPILMTLLGAAAFLSWLGGIF